MWTGLSVVLCDDEAAQRLLSLSFWIYIPEVFFGYMKKLQHAPNSIPVILRKAAGYYRQTECIFALGWAETAFLKSIFF